MEKKEFSPLFLVMDKIPGGTMVVPLLLGAVFNTIGQMGIVPFSLPFLSSASMPHIFMVVMFCGGAQINFRRAPKYLGISFGLLVAKAIPGIVFGLLVANIFGFGGFLGISALACLAAITNSNGGIYYSLCSIYGDADDLITALMLGFNDGPYFTLMALGAAGLSAIPVSSIILSMSPLLLGILLGNIDSRLSKFCAGLTPLIMPFFGYSLGAGLNLINAVSAGFSGILLGIITLVLSGSFCILVDKKLLGGRGYRGAAIATVAGNAAATPALVAQMDPAWLPYVESSTACITAACVTTAILAPLLTSWAAKKWGCPKFEQESGKEITE